VARAHFAGSLERLTCDQERLRHAERACYIHSKFDARRWTFDVHPDKGENSEQRTSNFQRRIKKVNQDLLQP